jgi:hypothetical protein
VRKRFEYSFMIISPFSTSDTLFLLKSQSNDENPRLGWLHEGLFSTRWRYDMCVEEEKIGRTVAKLVEVELSPSRYVKCSFGFAFISIYASLTSGYKHDLKYQRYQNLMS